VAGPPVIPDEELCLRRVPPGSSWVRQGQLTSGNFQLKPGETGISVSRASITSPARLLRQISSPRGWTVAQTTARDIRHLGLDVIPKPTPLDAGHAEIIPTPCRLTHSVRRKLASVFEIIRVTDS